MRLTPAERAGLVADLERSSVAVREAERQRDRDVAEARQRGLTWDEVALGLGVSRQAAWNRYKSVRVGLQDQPLPDV